MHKMLKRMTEVSEEAHPKNNAMYEGLMGSVVKFAEDYTAESSIKAAESDAAASRSEANASRSQLETANTEISLIRAELNHAQSLAEEAIKNLEAAMGEMTRLKDDWREERRELKNGKDPGPDLGKERADLLKLAGKLEALIGKAKVQAPTPVPKAIDSNPPTPIFDIAVGKRDLDGKIKNVVLTPRGLF